MKKVWLTRQVEIGIGAGAASTDLLDTTENQSQAWTFPDASIPEYLERARTQYPKYTWSAEDSFPGKLKVIAGMSQ